MNEFEFEHQLHQRCLKLRWALNRTAQCLNNHATALERARVSAEKSGLRLAASTQRLANCLEVRA